MIGRIGKQFVQVKKFRVDNLNPLLYNKYKKCKQRGKEHENKTENILEGMGNEQRRDWNVFRSIINYNVSNNVRNYFSIIWKVVLTNIQTYVIT